MYKLGTNQYKKKKPFVHTHKFTVLVFGSFMLCIFFLGLITRSEALQQAWASEPLVSPVVNEVSVTPTPVQTEQQKIEQEIKDVFGNFYPKAKQLLDCENHARNPKAVNDNTTWGGVGQDIGIFQINTKWQGVTNRAFLYDYHINIRMAYNIFSRDNYSFKLWTCGRNLGI